nr:AIPR family protein [Bacteroides intestinalis]
MSSLKVKRITSYLEKHIKDRIDISDISRRPALEVEKATLSRSLAAYSLVIVAGANIDDACNAVTDGFEDNGLDAIYYDKDSLTLWLVQAKYIMDGTSGIDNGDIEKYCKGVKRLIDGAFDKFNQKIKDKQDEILEALDNSRVKIQLLLAYTGRQLSSHNLDSLNELLEEQNDTDELLALHDFNVDKAYKGLEFGMVAAPISEDMLISNWGYMEEPLKSYYGQISGMDLGNLWSKYGKRLFTENIRNFLGSSSVNDEISNTIKNEPENFIYFNNGITILCDSIKKKPMGGSDKSIGAFTCDGISVVNGAQTLGSIGSLYESNPEELNKTKVFVKLISLEGVDKTIGVRITVATNTQNKVDKKDFVSLDPEQYRIKIELQMEGVDYYYKRSNDRILPDDNNYLFEEVAFGLASAYNNVDYSTMIKKESGRLWNDASTPPYTELFNSTLTALKIKKAVRIYRLVTNMMNEKANLSTGRERSIYKYGNALVSHIVMQKIPTQVWADSYPNFDDYFNTHIKQLVDVIIDKLKECIEEEYPEAMIVYVLRNYTKCRHLKNLLMS